MKNERTSKRVASDAGAFMRMTDDEIRNIARTAKGCARIRGVAASAATQAADRYDDRGFDPRDGGKVGRAHVPKQKATRKREGKPASSPFYPSARPPKNSL